VWLFVALLLLVNAIFVLPGLLMEGWAWLRELRDEIRLVSRSYAKHPPRMPVPPPTPANFNIVAVSERDRLNVVVRICDFQKARSH
jgi:hypothetical protein